MTDTGKRNRGRPRKNQVEKPKTPPLQKRMRRMRPSIVIEWTDGFSTYGYGVLPPFEPAMSEMLRRNQPRGHIGHVDWYTSFQELIKNWEPYLEVKNGGTSYAAPGWNEALSPGWFGREALSLDGQVESAREEILRIFKVNLVDEDKGKAQLEYLDQWLCIFFLESANLGALSMDYNWRKHSEDVYSGKRQRESGKDGGLKSGRENKTKAERRRLVWREHVEEVSREYAEEWRRSNDKARLSLVLRMLKKKFKEDKALRDLFTHLGKELSGKWYREAFINRS